MSIKSNDSDFWIIFDAIGLGICLIYNIVADLALIQKV